MDGRNDGRLIHASSTNAGAPRDAQRPTSCLQHVRATLRCVTWKEKAMLQPLIIEAAINGATPKAMNPHVPRAVPEIVECACTCLAAGAAIVHHHNDEGLLEGRHASKPYRAAWTQIYERYPDALLYPTMGGGGPHTTITERYAHVEELADAD